MKISLGLLVRLLAENKFKFVITKSEQWADKTVLQFLATEQFSTEGGFLANKQQEDKENVLEDRRKDRRLLMHYDVDNQKVISSCYQVYKILDEMHKKVTQNVTKTPCISTAT